MLVGVVLVLVALVRVVDVAGLVAVVLVLVALVHVVRGVVVMLVLVALCKGSATRPRAALSSRLRLRLVLP